MIRTHCRQHRSKMNDPATFKVMADMVDEDVGQWTSTWFTKALVFKKQHPSEAIASHVPGRT